jgi:hypothetical protein
MAKIKNDTMGLTDYVAYTKRHILYGMRKVLKQFVP